MSELVLPAPGIWTPDYGKIGERLRLPKWAKPWGRTKEDALTEFALVQSNHTNNSGTGSSLAFSSNVTAGNLLLFAISYDNAVTITSVTGGGTWARVGTSQNDATKGQRCEWWYAENATGGATTVNFTTCAAYGLVIAEFSGVQTSGSLDTQDTTLAFLSSTSGVDWNSNNITPAASGELLVSIAYDNGGIPTFTQGGTWTAGPFESGAVGTGSSAMSYKTGSTGAQNANWQVNKTGDSVTSQIAAFKVTGGGGGAQQTVNLSGQGIARPTKLVPILP